MPFSKHQKRVKLPNEQGYFLELSIDSSNSFAAISTSKNYISVLDLNSLSTQYSSLVQQQASKNDCTISQIQFSKNQQTQSIISTSIDKNILIFDTRVGVSPIQSISCDLNIDSFDYNSSGQLLSIGTSFSKIHDGSKILFYDSRNASEILSEFNDSHSDDITQVKFHPFENILLTGSTDGIINCFDTSTLIEDDSIQWTIRDNSIHRLGFFGPSYEYCFSLTHIETFGLYRISDAETIQIYGDVRTAVDSTLVEYIIDCQYVESLQRLLLFGGSRGGGIGILNVDIEGLSLLHSLEGGHNETVRGTWFNENNGKMLTTSEDATACLWQFN